VPNFFSRTCCGPPQYPIPYYPPQAFILFFFVQVKIVPPPPIRAFRPYPSSCPREPILKPPLWSFFSSYLLPPPPPKPSCIRTDAPCSFVFSPPIHTVFCPTMIFSNSIARVCLQSNPFLLCEYVNLGTGLCRVNEGFLWGWN